MQAYLRRILPILQLGVKFVPLIPTSQDNWPQRISKVVGLFHVTHEVYNGGVWSKMRTLKERYSLVETESEAFVKLFFATTLRDLFELRRHTLDQHEELVEAVGQNGERLFFRETSYGVRHDFFATPNVDFSKIIGRLWKDYPNGIFLSVTREKGGWETQTSICEVPSVPIERLSRSAQERLKKAIKVHEGFVRDGTHRCYLAFGPPGSGKSSFAVLFAREFGGRALKIDATSLPIMNVKEFGFLIDILQPSFLILDDMDRAPIAEVGARVLFLLERLKTHYPKLTVILTVNDPSKLDSALLRCGRIDVPWKFAAPERAELETVVRGLLRAHEVAKEKLTEADMTKIIESSSSEELTYAYLDDLCRRLRHEDVSDVLESISLLKSLASPPPNGIPKTSEQELKKAPDPV